MGTNKRIYRAKPKSWGLGESGTGKEQVAVEFDVLTEGADTEVITWYGYFTDNTWERTIESLRYCGWKGDLVDELNEKQPGPDASEVDLVLEDEEYEGKWHTRVQWVNRVGGLAIKTPLTGDRAKSFAASMRDRIRALDAAKGEKRPAKSAAPNGKAGALPPEPPPHTDADAFKVPF